MMNGLPRPHRPIRRLLLRRAACVFAACWAATAQGLDETTPSNDVRSIEAKHNVERYEAAAAIQTDFKVDFGDAFVLDGTMWFTPVYGAGADGVE